MSRKHPSPQRDGGSLTNTTSSRRDFLKGAATAAVGLMVPAARRMEAATLLPTVALGSHRVTRLIVGGNPICGYSHFNRQYDQHMREWFTDDRVVQLILDCERAGINTWQANFNYDLKRQFPKIRDAGCAIQFICLAASWHFDEKMGHTPEEVLEGTIKCAEAAMEFKPIGIAFHGAATDILYRAGRSSARPRVARRCMLNGKWPLLRLASVRTPGAAHELATTRQLAA